MARVALSSVQIVSLLAPSAFFLCWMAFIAAWKRAFALPRLIIQHVRRLAFVALIFSVTLLASKQVVVAGETFLAIFSEIAFFALQTILGANAFVTMWHNLVTLLALIILKITVWSAL